MSEFHITPTETEKVLFIEAWAASGNALDAATAVYGTEQINLPKVLYAARMWPNDPAFIRAKAEYEKSGQYSKQLPSKEQLLFDIYTRMQRARFAEDYEKLAKLYASMAGFVEKPKEANASDTQRQVVSVMRVRDMGTNEEWEAKAAAQQRQLQKATQE